MSDLPSDLPAGRGRGWSGPGPASPEGDPDVELHVEELVLRGFAPADRHHIGDALQRALTRLIATHGLPIDLDGEGLAGRLSHPTEIDAGTIVLPSASGAVVGEWLAAAVYRSLGGRSAPATGNQGSATNPMDVTVQPRGGSDGQR